MKKLIKTLVLSAILLSCSSEKEFEVSDNSIEAGSVVKIFGKDAKLSKGSLKIGDNFISKVSKTDIGFKFNNKVTIINLVPSVDTPVCEVQTHELGESEGLDGIDLVTISRDLPMAQSRFAKEAKLENIKYYSDYKSGSFGMMTGTMIEGPELLTRAVLVLSAEGIVKYIQLVEDIKMLPNMKKAFSVAKKLK